MLRYSADFETTTSIDDCRVWLWGIVELHNHDNFNYGTTIDSFIDFISKKSCIIYFHNAKFDCSFIIDYLLKNGFTYSNEEFLNAKEFSCVMTNTNIFYMMKICFKRTKKDNIIVTIYDSLKKLPFSVKKIGIDFNLEEQKLNIDYNKERNNNYVVTDEEIKYLYHDVIIVAKAIEIQIQEGMTSLTIGADCLKIFKNIIGGEEIFREIFPLLDKKDDENIRRAYRGGFCYVNTIYQELDIEEGQVYDVNSLYPYVMDEKILPYDQAKYFKGRYQQDTKYPLYVTHIILTAKLKEGYIPTIQIKGNWRYNATEYLDEVDDVDLWVTNIDLDLIMDHYHIVEIKYIDGYKFKGRVGIFHDYIDKFRRQKMENTGAKRLLAKLFLNNLYGKFSTSLRKINKKPTLIDNTVKWVIDQDKLEDGIYIPVGVFITSHARNLTIRTAQDNFDRFLYADTDSIHIKGNEVPNIKVDDSKFGYWKLESKFEKARFIRAKTYIEIYKDNLNVKCAGMNDEVKSKVTWENFHRGAIYEGKLRPVTVSGGIVLLSTTFKIR